MAEKIVEAEENDGMRKYYFITCLVFGLMSVYCFMYWGKWSHFTCLANKWEDGEDPATDMMCDAEVSCGKSDAPPPPPPADDAPADGDAPAEGDAPADGDAPAADGDAAAEEPAPADAAAAGRRRRLMMSLKKAAILERMRS